MALRSTRFRTLVVVAVVCVALAAYAFTKLGRFLAKEDALQQADAIVVLAGTRMNRALEAAELYQRGYAPHVVLTYQVPEQSLATLGARGITLPADADITREVLEKLGIPAGAITLPPTIHNNTAKEAQTFRALAAANGWRRLIVVTSKYHLRRAGFAMRRELAGTGVTVAMHGTRYDDSDPDRWWTRRRDWPSVVIEAGKLLAYELGLGA